MPPDFATVVPTKSISRKLEEVVFRALQKTPDKRFQSMEEFKLALEDTLKDFDRVRRRNSSSSVLNDARTLSATAGGAAPSPVKTPAPAEASGKELLVHSDRVKYIVFSLLICLLLVGGGVAIGLAISKKHAGNESSAPGPR
jgi:hypothetical protein